MRGEDQVKWQKRWKDDEVGFHKSVYNEDLLANSEAIQPLKVKVVLVPLCGKSLDMLWFVKQGAFVIGVE